MCQILLYVIYTFASLSPYGNTRRYYRYPQLTNASGLLKVTNLVRSEYESQPDSLDLEPLLCHGLHFFLVKGKKQKKRKILQFDIELRGPRAEHAKDSFKLYLLTSLSSLSFQIIFLPLYVLITFSFFQLICYMPTIPL